VIQEKPGTLKQLMFTGTGKKIFEGETGVWYLEAVKPGKASATFKNEMSDKDSPPLLLWQLRQNIEVIP
jgi:hypothetical protein